MKEGEIKNFFDSKRKVCVVLFDNVFIIKKAVDSIYMIQCIRCDYTEVPILIKSIKARLEAWGKIINQDSVSDPYISTSIISDNSAMDLVIRQDRISYLLGDVPGVLKTIEEAYAYAIKHND